MPIVYTVVSRRTTPLVEHGTEESHETLRVASRRILEIAEGKEDECMSYAGERYQFHVKFGEDGLLLLCIASKDYPQQVCFNYLNDIQNKFEATYGSAFKDAHSWEFNKDFAPFISQQMEYYSKNPQQVDPLKRALKSVAEAKETMKANVEQLKERERKLEELAKTTTKIRERNKEIQKEAKKENTELKRGERITMLIGILMMLVAVGLGVYLFLYGGFKRS